MGKEKTKRKKAGEEPSAELSKRLDEMQMQIDILAETINVLKKDPRISQKPLKAREKAAIADALKGKYPLRRLLSALSLGKKLLFLREEGEIESGQVRRPKSQAARRIPGKPGSLRIQEAQAMPSARIRPPVRKSRQEAHEGARPVEKTEKASEVFLVPGRIVASGA